MGGHSLSVCLSVCLSNVMRKSTTPKTRTQSILTPTQSLHLRYACTYCVLVDPVPYRGKQSSPLQRNPNYAGRVSLTNCATHPAWHFRGMLCVCFVVFFLSLSLTRLLHVATGLVSFSCSFWRWPSSSVSVLVLQNNTSCVGSVRTMPTTKKLDCL
jgi:hypothetical protein